MEDIYKKITSEFEFGPDDTENSEIQTFFAGQTIFLTGCTGYLGKCLVEKLLRSCPDIKKLYLMVRTQNVPPKDRIQEYFQHLLFNKLHESQPNFISKVVVVEGNLLENEMGLADKDRKMIANEVTLIIHNASNVKFEARVSKLLRCNVLGTKYMINLAKQCKNLKCFVYVSTAYSHCYQKVIEEKCYSSPADLKEVEDYIEVDEQTPNGIADSARKSICHPWPNYYVYSKAIAESLVEEYAKESNSACMIFRPSVMVSTYQEPIAAWCGNTNGPAGAFLACGLGIIHSGYMKMYPLDMIPTDMCVNALLATIWEVMTNRNENIGSVMVFNYGSSTINPITLDIFERSVQRRGRKTPPSKMLAPYFMTITPAFHIFVLIHIFVHFLLALLADIILLTTFQKPKALTIFWKITMNLDKIHYFTNGNWRIYIDETKKVWDHMSEQDRHIFFCDLRLLDWAIFTHNYWAGLRVYLLNDPISNLPSARRRYLILQALYNIIKASAYAYMVYYVINYVLIIMSPVTLYTLRKLCDMYC